MALSKIQSQSCNYLGFEISEWKRTKAMFSNLLTIDSSICVFLQKKNSNLCEMIHQERQQCLDVKVQIRMIQMKQLEAAGGMEKDLLIFDE